MQILFQIDAQDDWENPDFEKYAENVTVEDEKEYEEGIIFGDQTDYAKTLVKEICAKHADIDAMIDARSRGWSTARMAKTDLAVLRLAVGEILFMENVPNGVAINEAVNLAKKYGEEQSPRFINGVLSKINQTEGTGEGM